MELVLRKQHPKGFWTIFRNLDLNLIFKKRDRDWFNIDRDFCVYVWKDPNGRIQYIGMGRYYEDNWTNCRPLNHNNDMLTNTITTEWTCEILFYGASSLEAHIVEAHIITLSNRNRSHRGQYVWDGESLINKKREKKYERMIEEYLNLDGNNYWETIRREINGY